MDILVIGSGGREHAIAWRLARSPKVFNVFVAPGNAGTAIEPKIKNLPINHIKTLVNFARNQAVQFTVVGPEAPLAAGIVDIFRAEELPIFGPTQAAAQLESSKDFAKQFLTRHNIPTARYQSFTQAQAAHDYVEKEGAPIGIKADGLAAGKGVVVAMTLQEAHAAIDMMLDNASLGQAGARVVIEEFMQGEEASFIVMADGTHALALPTSQDHKRLLDNDQGPNTGGMGAYSPAPVVTPEIHSRVIREIIKPTLIGMAAEGTPYTGFLYAGLMIDASGAPRVVEFNCRMGDPEAQPIMMRLKSDLVDLIEAALAGQLNNVDPQWDRRVALGVVLASKNYPSSASIGDVITGLPPLSEESDTHVFHAATQFKDGQFLTDGGRVLCVTALGESVKLAQQKAYALADTITFDGKQLRRDIGHRGIKRPSGAA